jgi:hypothetical protein
MDDRYQKDAVPKDSWMYWLRSNNRVTNEAMMMFAGARCVDT